MSAPATAVDELRDGARVADDAAADPDWVALWLLGDLDEVRDAREDDDAGGSCARVKPTRAAPMSRRVNAPPSLMVGR
jgi:hypothetical protein